ncbi:MAG: SMC-Scp complex subunit ScpB [Candidatus Eisenbacteria bacterium]|nr:SMC-Scp complex subunit ScpB [Candidatus Eisenbacteria bacterium]
MESQQNNNTKRVLEALFFAADEPMTIRQIRRILPEAEAKEIQDAVRELREEYDREGRSFQVVEIERGYQIFTRKEYFSWIRKMRTDLKAMRLSRAAVETLAIIAYRQPVTRPEIEQIRGVDAGGVLKTLLDRNLITLRGRAEGVGRPILYGTTDHFLNHFGLKGLEDLPRIEELTELMKAQEMEEVEEEVERRLGPAEEEGPEEGEGGEILDGDAFSEGEGVPEEANSEEEETPPSGASAEDPVIVEAEAEGDAVETEETALSPHAEEATEEEPAEAPGSGPDRSAAGGG